MGLVRSLKVHLVKHHNPRQEARGRGINSALKRQKLSNKQSKNNLSSYIAWNAIRYPNYKWWPSFNFTLELLKSLPSRAKVDNFMWNWIGPLHQVSFLHSKWSHFLSGSTDIHAGLRKYQAKPNSSCTYQSFLILIPFQQKVLLGHCVTIRFL